MSPARLLSLVIAAAALTSCNPFRGDPAVQVTTTDANLNTRWHANLATPAELAGAVQMNGSASMTPGSENGNTIVSLDLANATPGGQHPWQLRRGQCGADDGMIGGTEAYPVAQVGRDGRATATARLPFNTPTAGSYFVVVRASAAYDAVTVACGNLAPPTL